MGSCLSSGSKQYPVRRPTAKVIAADGSLKEYSVPVTASSALGHDKQSCFLCNSDELYFDARIPALRSEELLQLGRIYFALPIAKLDHRLMGADMLALVVKASAALPKKSDRGGKARMMPVVEVYEEVGDDDILPARSITV